MENLLNLLQPGYVVLTKIGYIYIVTDTCLVRKGSYINISSYDKSLKNLFNPVNDIIKIYKSIKFQSGLKSSLEFNSMPTRFPYYLYPIYDQIVECIRNNLTQNAFQLIYPIQQNMINIF